MDPVKGGAALGGYENMGPGIERNMGVMRSLPHIPGVQKM